LRQHIKEILNWCLQVSAEDFELPARVKFLVNECLSENFLVQFVETCLVLENFFSPISCLFLLDEYFRANGSSTGLGKKRATAFFAFPLLPRFGLDGIDSELRKA
jgi:hypothetical protein